ncbi:MAG: DUF3574 domain-containing protein [Gammaproteobacteria bacterium]|nr:MAG: DUF3574 domain-containing protein [Gammaproteobacteria bacterium]
MKRFLPPLLLSFALAGCASVPTGERWVRSEVYFGLSKPDGSLISNAEWQIFMDEVVTPEFPAGLSVVDTAGQWRNATGHIDREQSKMLVLLHPPGAATEARIDAIRAAYRKRFSQEAVMKVTTPVRVAF